MKLNCLTWFLLVLCAGTTTAYAELELVRVWPGYRDAASFTSASEYFDGPAAKSHRIALRTQPEARAGYYWLVRTKSPHALTNLTIFLEVTRSGSTDSNHYEFTHDIAHGSHAVPIGLTGSDWSSPDEAPIAWRLTIQSPEGQTLATQSSFLWQEPNR